MYGNKTIALAYHDVVPAGDFDSSGFPGGQAARYKLDRILFRRHLEAIRSALGNKCIECADIPTLSPVRVLLTFDDGGISAYDYIAGALEEYGWRGHFLITTGCIGRRGFMDAGQILQLRKRGHVIGTHSWRHPVRMAGCSWDVLIDEWGGSVQTLSGILGEPIRVAALPGGAYASKVARAAAAVGIKVLFTSNPSDSPKQVHTCKVRGRYPLLQFTSPAVVHGIVAGDVFYTASQQLTWKAKGVLRKALGPAYAKLRGLALRENEDGPASGFMSDLAPEIAAREVK